MILVDRHYPVFALAKRVWHRRKKLGLCGVVRDPNGLDWVLIGRTANQNRRTGFHLFAAGLGVPPNVTVDRSNDFEVLQVNTDALARLLLEYKVGKNGWIIQVPKLILPGDQPVLYA